MKTIDGSLPFVLEAQLLEVFTEPPPAPSATRCGCCGSRTELQHFVLDDLRLWASCSACVDCCPHCQKHLEGAREVTP